MKYSTRWILAASVALSLAAGSALADHYHFGPSGGSSGAPFVDTAPDYTRIAAVRVWAGSHVDAIQLVYRERRGFVEGRKYGGNGGRLYVFELDRGEQITAISGHYGRLVNGIRFHTNRRHTSPLFGTESGAEFHYEAPRGLEIAGFHGRSGSALDAIGVLLRER